MVIVEAVKFVFLDCALTVDERIGVELNADSRSGIAMIITVIIYDLFILSA